MTATRDDRLRVGFLMDAIETVIVGHDTTFAFILECRRRGHEVRVFEQRHLGWRDGSAEARMRTVDVRRVKGDHFTVLAEERAPLSDLDVLFLRKDPPVDVEFLYATLLADLVSSRVFIVNDPSGLRDANEHLFVLRFPDLVPRTLVSRDLGDLRAFLDELGGQMIVKPIDGFAGRGVFHVRRDDRNLNSVLEVMTERGTRPVIAQAYLPESREGDKRIILLEGEPLGALLRKPAEGDVRANLAAGGTFHKTALTPREREICRRLAPELAVRGLYFVGLDVIGDHLTEVNVTSPTGVEEANALDGVRIESDVVDFVERKVAERR